MTALDTITDGVGIYGASAALRVSGRARLHGRVRLVLLTVREERLTSVTSYTVP